MANIPVYNTNNFSFGPGILSLAAITMTAAEVDESSDIVDVGGVRSGGTFNVTRTKLEVFQGSPQALAKQYVTNETAQLSLNGIEWNIANLRLALGAGVVVTGTAGSAPDTISFGGDVNLVDTAVKFVHVAPSGFTLTVRIWRGQGDGAMNVTFGDDLHEIPYTFNALDSASEWAPAPAGTGAALTTGSRLFRISKDFD